MSDQFPKIVADRLHELIEGSEPKHFGERLFVKGYQDAISGKPLLRCYFDICEETEEGFSDLDETEITYFMSGFSVGIETRAFQEAALLRAPGGNA